MTDGERDEIDSEAQKFIKLSRDRINSLQEHCMCACTCNKACICVNVVACAAVNDSVSGEQMNQYRQAVYESLQDYLKSTVFLSIC